MNCIIVDDEPLAREEMRNLVEEISAIEIMGEFSNALSAMEYLATKSVDLIFLDIEMPTVNGLDFAQSLPKDVLVILTTAYTQYALRGFELDALDYLLKPIKKDRLAKAIDKALTYKNLLNLKENQSTFEDANEDAVFIKSDRKYYKILFDDIRFIEALKDYVVIYTRTNKLITAMNLKTMHQKLPARLFVRVSKSYLINLSFIDSFDNHTIYIDKFEIPIGEIYREQFFKQYTGGLL
ncbi:LytTR family DNA-binding domain-containing protein [Sphingobacterium sp. BIGb0165]|uniref:LytR/AlgR family response regulator transcription factor n=1 Tax=Sphingobacterium sp. BIGb0165 TaxID=2940615 RepID=UPI002167893A|nr:LytTR family DNA-binding domain-containing protein [Sphingobacterium sp. BIGb0165]MCS4224110.1 DNA-binding LytR/AlgR family response regulator [Sphingobacterium sp. BIGb0165]